MIDYLVTALQNRSQSKPAIGGGGASWFACFFFFFLSSKISEGVGSPFCCLQVLFAESGAALTEAAAPCHFNAGLDLSALRMI